MKNICLVLAIFCLAIFSTQAAHYAVLVAGSKGYENYRHQSDIYHAYQILIGYGFPAENIITMAYDDIATDPSNPFPGKVFNKPTKLFKPGKDVYAGVQIDYRGDEVTSANFLAVLKGDSTAVGGKRVLQSTEEDNVFVYFEDHGGVGMICFPADTDYLYADDLIKTLNYMHDNNMYKELVFYLSACHSGSMFENLLPNNINIYATTAATPNENGWGTYCSPDDHVGGKSIGSCLGSLYSISFLENLESVDTSKETLQEQYNIIKKRTTKSHVQQYGDLSMTPEIIGNFQANKNVNQPFEAHEDNQNFESSSSVVSTMNKLYYLQNKHSRLQSQQSYSELAEELESIQRFDSHFEALASKFDLNLDEPVGQIDFACLKARVAMYEKVCGVFSDYGLKYVKYLHYSCVQGVDIYDFEETLLKTCI